MRAVVFFVLLGVFAGAHLEAGFDRTVGPYALDVGWDPVAPNVGEKTVFKVSVRDASSLETTDLSGVLLRFEKGEKVWFAGTLDLAGGDAVLTYAFPETGSWTIRILTPGRFSESSEITVPGKAPTFESAGWILAGLFCVILAVQTFRKAR